MMTSEENRNCQADDSLGLLRNCATICILLFLLVNTGLTQGIGWEKYYGIPDRGEYVACTKESYDKGYLVGMVVNGNDNMQHTWLLKSDINGNALWSKTFYDQTFAFILYSLDVDQDGGIILVGQTNQFDNQGDPFIMKLDACGQKIWCRALHYPSMNFSRMVVVKNDDYLVLTNFASDDFQEGNQLRTFDAAGNQLSVAQLVPYYENQDLTNAGLADFILTSDNGILFTGYCYYRMPPPNQNTTLLQHLFVKTDSLGNEVWVRPSAIDNNHVGSLLSSTEQSGSYYAVGYSFTGYPEYSPYFCKISVTGQLTFEKMLHPDTLFDNLRGIRNCGLNDFIIVGTGTTNLNDPASFRIFKTDTSGNILKYIQNDHGVSYYKCLTTTFNSKYLVSGFAPYNYTNQLQTDGYLVKINQNLDYDSIYTFPFVYDSLCSAQIPTDTIDCNCDLITGLGEGQTGAHKVELNIFPNPARDEVRIMVTGEIKKESDLKLLVYDLFGRQVMRLPFRKEVRMDVSWFTAGVYIVSVEKEGTPVAWEKMVVFR
jgi:hypothetical protein